MTDLICINHDWRLTVIPGSTFRKHKLKYFLTTISYQPHHQISQPSFFPLLFSFLSSCCCQCSLSLSSWHLSRRTPQHLLPFSSPCTLSNLEKVPAPQKSTVPSPLDKAKVLGDLCNLFPSLIWIQCVRPSCYYAPKSERNRKSSSYVIVVVTWQQKSFTKQFFICNCSLCFSTWEIEAHARSEAHAKINSLEIFSVIAIVTRQEKALQNILCM